MYAIGKITIFFFFNDTATTEIYTLSLHDALPIYVVNPDMIVDKYGADTLRMYEMFLGPVEQSKPWDTNRSEEHTSELQSRQYLVCRLLLEKKTSNSPTTYTLIITR